MLINRAGPGSVALETTLLIHGVPNAESRALASDLTNIITSRGVHAAIVGVLAGQPITGLNDAELSTLLNAETVAKANTSNLGVFINRRQHAATTVSTTMELAAAAGIRIFATGGLGGVHRNYAQHLDISADLAAFTRFPVAVVASGVKSILDVAATREALETLGVPVVGYRTTRFPAFYLRESDSHVDATFDDIDSLASFVKAELARTGRGILIANPIPHADELPREDWDHWLKSAIADASNSGVTGRDFTPFVLANLHRTSAGKTLQANLALVRNNAALAADLCRAMLHAR